MTLDNCGRQNRVLPGLCGVASVTLPGRLSLDDWHHQWRWQHIIQVKEPHTWSACKMNGLSLAASAVGGRLMGGRL